MSHSQNPDLGDKSAPYEKNTSFVVVQQTSKQEVQPDPIPSTQSAEQRNLEARAFLGTSIEDVGTANLRAGGYGPLNEYPGYCHVYVAVDSTDPHARK
ncbi:hypothetical protein RUND412_006603 [Rhizina undulata]